MRINYNKDAARANNTLLLHERNMSKSMNRLSSGKKIALKDAPANYAIAGKIDVYIKGTKVAKESSVNGISAIHVADGVLNEITSMVHRLNELSIQASNEILSENDKSILNNEAQSLLEEIQRMADTAQFNGQNLLDGSFDNKGYITTNGQQNPNFKLLSISDDFDGGNFTIENNKVYKDGEIYLDGTATLDDDNILTLTDQSGKEIKVQTDGTQTKMELEYPKFGPMTLQIGANKDETINVRIPQVSLTHLGLKNFDLVNNADDCIKRASNALSTVTNIRSRLGAYENRLEHTQANLDVVDESLTSSYSKIMDTDMAEEMVNYSTQQILVQATMQVLTQINQTPEKVLQLLN